MVLLRQSLLLLALTVQAANGSLYTISDDRIRSMDITPVLGRGYSIMTDKFHSTCLVVEDTTVPSFNYDCKWIQIQFLMQENDNISR